ncbi:MAG: 2-succinyl-5-enolpyruvyl-6-hydroxy-3-cyclohexene-1-carboxylic-acid synthase [Acidimicrobiales bacterium]
MSGGAPVIAQATFAATLVDEWARAGVAHAVVAPGSRSTPLALALAGDERVALHVHHDERAAGFVALGVGLATGVPAVVLTTSGTAAAELHPAVVEASQARVPLLVCTADRPPELHHVGAPQAVDQTHLYGRSARWFCQPGVPDPATAHTWRSLGARAVAEATGSPPGPVHLDLAFAEPLTGRPGPLPEGREDGAPWHRAVGPIRGPVPAEADRLAELLGAERGVVVAGPGAARDDPAGVAALAGAARWPVLADPGSGCRLPGPTTVAAFDALLRHRPFAEAQRPEAVLRLGPAPASKALARWLAESGARQVLIEADGRWLDPDRTAAVVVAGSPSGWCRALAERLGGAGGGGWLGSWAAAETAAQAAIEEVLAAHPEPTEPGVARGLAAVLPEGARLVVSSSMPVRDLEWYAAPRPGLAVLANRGANGIDGVVSTAVGVATATGGPVAALVGDLAFLHDANALLGLAGRGLDLTVVVVDNRGGGIFSFLPQADLLDHERFEMVLGTPHQVDLVALAGAHGLSATEVAEAAALAPAVAGALGAEGTHVVVVRTDREANVAVHDELHAAVAGALQTRFR